MLKFDAIGASLEKNPVPKEMVEQLRRLTPVYNVLIESRFQTMNRLLEAHPDRQIVDLPCGYTPRGIRMSRQGHTYFGFDLPAVIDEIGPAVETIIGKNENVTYRSVDATNYASFEGAFTDANQNLLITTEGLLMYFSQSELEEVFANIKMILQKHGGSWVTTDRAYFLHSDDITAATVENDPRLIAMYKAITGKFAGSVADVAFNANVFFDPDDEKVKAFISKMGFELKEFSMAEYLAPVLGSVSEKMEKAVRKVFETMYIWEFTVKDQAEETRGTGKTFGVKMDLQDGILNVAVTGRMDTLTAPELLAKFQAVSENVEAIEIDASDMEYISSAGLRVLMIMYKSLVDKSRFNMLNPNEYVTEILETSGFAQLFLQ